MQQALPQQTALPPGPVQITPLQPAASARADEAAAFEQAGFEAILDRRLDDAIAAFEQAREVWPDYHNVAEIAAYLARAKATEAPLDAATWAAVDRTILTKYSWGMPANLRDAFRARISASS